MLPNLSPFFDLPVRSYAEGVTLRTTPMLSFADMLGNNSNLLFTHIHDNGFIQGVQKDRAKASVWHMHYTLRILPSIVVSQSLLNTPLPLRLDELSFGPMQCTLYLPHQGTPQHHNDTEVRYHDFLFNHLTPLHAYLNQEFGVPEKVLWSNTLFRINSVFEAVKKIAGNHSTLQKDQATLLNSASLGLKRNPLFFKKVTCHDGRGSYRLRPECCFLHEVEDSHYCRDCPKKTNNMTQRQ